MPRMPNQAISPRCTPAAGHRQPDQHCHRPDAREEQRVEAKTVADAPPAP